MKVKKHATDCLVARCVDIVGDRWSLLIIRDILLHNKKTFGEFRDAGEGIATNVLTDRLKFLEDEGIVTKSRDPDDGKRNIYALTAKGLDLAPVILEIVRWSGTYFPVDKRRAAMVARIEHDKDAYLDEITQLGKAEFTSNR